MKKKHTITFCMGSSCFSRGNNKSIQKTQKYIQENNLEDLISVSACLCENKCTDGPHIKINGNTYNEIYENTVIDLIKLKIKE